MDNELLSEIRRKFKNSFFAMGPFSLTFKCLADFPAHQSLRSQRDGKTAESLKYAPIYTPGYKQLEFGGAIEQGTTNVRF